jgi:hypothetical protein
MIVSSHRRAQKSRHSSRSARLNRESLTFTPWSVRFGESRSANDDAPPHSRAAPLATHLTHITLQGQRVKPGNRARPQSDPFWRKLGQRTTTLRQQLPVGSVKPKGPHRIVTLSHSEPLRGTKLGATRRGSTLCCPGRGYISSECRQWAPTSTVWMLG